MIARISRGTFLGLGLISLAAPSVALAAQRANDPESQTRRMLDALRDKDYEAFLADANDKFRAYLGKAQFEGVSNLVSARLEKGYKIFYLAKLRQQGFDSYLYKLECADRGDEHLVKISLKDGKVGGFLVQ